MDYLAQPAVLTAGLGVAAAAYYFSSQPKPVQSNIPFDRQSVVLPGPERVRANPLHQEKCVTGPLEGVNTLYDAFRHGVELARDLPCLGSRTGPNKEYEWQTYGEVLLRVTHFGSGLLEKFGLKPNELVGIFAPNCIEWVITEQACSSYSMVSVPLYDTLGDEAMVFILNQTKISLVVCDPKKIGALLAVASKTQLRSVVSMGDVTSEQQEAAKKVNVGLYTLAELERLGKDNVRAFIPPSASDLATICYTSGTTGNPKGAMLTHENMLSTLGGVVAGFVDCIKIDTNTVYLSYLPLAHMFEREGQLLAFFHGGRVGFFSGDVKLIMDDLAALRPTIFPSVPRLLNRVYDKVMDGVKQGGFVKKTLFNMAMESKKAELAQHVVRRDSFWDKLVFSKIQARLGGRVEVVITGAAPLSDEVLTFLRCALGCPVLQGYGQTETGAAATITLVGDNLPGRVGPPLASNRMKLASVPEMNYFADNDEGEVCYKGPNIFKGYYNDEEKTRETFDEDGWMHSGDIGRWNADGSLSIIDRKKNIFKLAQGEYLAPEKIEMAYGCAPFVGQVFLHGDSFQPWCVAIIVPDEVVLARWAAEEGIAGDFADLCQNEDVRAAVLKEVTLLGVQSGLKSFEQAKAIHLSSEPFSIENDLLTPTMKLKRPQLKKFYQREIADMYKKLEAAQKK